MIEGTMNKNILLHNPIDAKAFGQFIHSLFSGFTALVP